VSAISVTLKTKAIMPWAVTVRRIVRDVTATSETCVAVPLFESDSGRPSSAPFGDEAGSLY
jgi:hypothetical protein